MDLFKKNWTEEEADRWTIHDLLASLLGVTAYFLITVGIIGAFLLQLWGFICVGVALILAWIMYRVIDPKLRVMSSAFHSKQEEYVERLERSVRWEQHHGD
jgi:small-conductance mechanosensitive channel